MGYKETYNRWLTSDVVDDDTKAELKSIENNEKEIQTMKVFMIESPLVRGIVS